ncbi:hypothetical protein FRB99_001032 [Tulasnella sp. 403]|nr:hypothetical protein FRB99_001032 [Tulasnella sp. 403]
MPVPVPRRSSIPPPPSSPPSNPVAQIKQRQHRPSASPVLPPRSSLPPMNGHPNGYTNGHAAPNGSTANGVVVDLSGKPRHRKSGSKRSAKRMSGGANGATSAPASGRCGHSDDEAERTHKAAAPDAGKEKPSVEEWTGIMKRIVEEWEIPRKVLHSSIGFGVVYLYSGRPETVNPVIYALAGSLAFIVPCDILRLRNAQFERLYEKAVGFLMRESERRSTNGVIWYMVGVIYVLALFPRDIAVVAILILSWCDTAASTFGRMYGKKTWPLPRRLLGLPLAPRKSVAGSAAAILTGALVAAGFWGFAVPQWQGYSIEAAQKWGTVAWKWSDMPGQALVSGGWPSLVAVSTVTGVISGVVEALDLGGWDDNLTLPVISGTVLWGLSKLAGLFLNFGY